MKKDRVNIQWEYHGKADFLVGTGATWIEKTLVWTASLLGAGMMLYLARSSALDWRWWQTLVAAALAFDVIGGVVANSVNACKRVYHAPVQADEPAYAPFFKNHLAFSALHVHPLLVALLFGSGQLFYGIFWYGLLLLASWQILDVPLYLRRPTAFLIIIASLLINQYLLPPVAGFEWLVPALYLKILYGHLVREEPYRP